MYWLRNELNETNKSNYIGPFNTIERAIAYKKKHHFFSTVINDNQKKKETREKK